MFTYPQKFEVIVVGAGHAGIEAGTAAARLGCQTLLLSQNLDTVGQMSCNPAIGGLAKGQIVREIDALGGFMGINTDATAIQCRMLNASKGPSVHAPRSQCDKKAYQFRAKAVCERQFGLHLKQGNVSRIIEKGGKVVGIETSLGVRYFGRAVVITAGTFMRGLLHIGSEQQSGGRMGDAASNLSDSLRKLGFMTGRFKTGTPCRIHGHSIDFSKCELQYGDEPPPGFSFVPTLLKNHKNDIFTINSIQNGEFHVEQVPCWITYTNVKTHGVVQENLYKSPMYAGLIEGVGPRYCPSIEDKVVKFPEKDRHQIFLEPEGRHSEEFYVNGVSTSLPAEVQFEFIRTICGLEQAEIMRAGYAVEYDFCPPTQLQQTLETKMLEGLYFAGQINGTSGYEEAAAQGLVAGANAALKVKGGKPFLLTRSNSYIGVLIDDLVTKGTTEPYRMFTSRAEHRLLLRHDNADMRLTPLGRESGLVDDERWNCFRTKQKSLESLCAKASTIRHEGCDLLKWIKRPENSYRKLPAEILREFSEETWFQFETDTKYKGYIIRQEASVAANRRNENHLLPRHVDYEQIAGLRAEAKQKLTQVLPETFGQASRINGITPADMAIIQIWMRSKSQMEG